MVARGMFFFLMLWLVLAVGLVIFRELTKQEKWKLFKVALVAGGLAVLAFLLVLGVVFVF